MTTTILIIIETVILIGLAVFIYRFVRETNERMNSIEKSVRNLSIISKYFPDFIQKGEKVSKNISEELTMKQTVLKKLISEAERASEKLEYVEEKVKEKKLDKETINKVLILVNQGFTPPEIAPKLNIPLGEIELVIKLRKYLNSPIKERL
ncbi:MAG: hypothetical protein GY940_28160 [bacterium]|nr:hypothetical protein [bacterium]